MDTLNRPRDPNALRDDGLHFVKGVLMGLADIVPGISGGTVALIVGIYQRLVTAISHVDVRLAGMLRSGKFSEAARYLDLRFLVGLGSGVVVGAAIMSVLMTRLLSTPTTHSLTMAVFFGLILGSSLSVAALVRPRSRSDAWRCLALGWIAALVAMWVSLLESPTAAVATAPNLGYLFVCGVIGICAMILPGISGAMILLLLGVYGYLMDIPRSLLRGEEVGANLSALIAMALGCGIGIVSFSRVVKWLLSRFHSATMSVLCGFMVGSLLKLWPFQRDLTPEIENFKYKNYQPYLPESWDGLAWGVLTAVVLSIAFVLGSHYVARRVPAPAAQAAPEAKENRA